MKNKKIIINVDMKNKRVRNGSAMNIEKEQKKKDEKQKEEKIKEQKQKEEIEIIEKNKDNIKNKKNIKRKSNEDEQKITKGITILNTHKIKQKEEREKRIGKTFKELKLENEQKDKIKNLKPIILTITSVIIIILIYFYFEYGPIIGISLNKNKESIKIDMVSTEFDFYDNYADELLVYSNQNLYTYNKQGKKTWNYTLDQMFTPKIYINGKYMIVSNNKNGNIYMFEDKKEILNKKVDGQIKEVYIDDYGNIAIEYDSNGYKKVVGIFNKNGKNLYNIYLENESIFDIKLIDNANKILIAKVNTTSFKSGVEIDLIDGTKEENNQKQLAKFDNNYIYDLTIEGQDIIMKLDDKLISVNIDSGKSKLIKEFDKTQILFITLNKNYYTCVEKNLNNENSVYELKNVKFDNTVISTINLKNTPKILINSGLLNYLIFQNEYKVMNKWGVEISTRKADVLPKKFVIFNNEKSIALVYTNTVYIINL